MIQLVKLPVKRGNAPLRIAKGHFVTNHSHINYYVDITYQKTRLSEARDSAYQLVSSFVNDVLVDTVLCLDGTAVLGTCIAEELTKSGFRTINAHETVYVVEPEYNANSQIIFRENIQPMIRGKHVLVLMASVPPASPPSGLSRPSSTMAARSAEWRLSIGRWTRWRVIL